MRQVQLELLLELPLPMQGMQHMMLHLQLRQVQGMLLMRMKLLLELLPRMRGLQKMMLQLKLRQEQGMLLSMKLQRKMVLQGLQQRLLM